ncbi:TPA: hypothetical protein DEP58_02730 [Patescibacteria group bacterium]|nr:MAG: hypothetical protein UU98_C0027G0027 [Parcubacteria group bacterium GW2011_GWD2_42_14]HCC05198.1 hypothetical protein [Patescibacteria group bacterium]
MNLNKTKKYQHLFFDLDNTLTRSRSPITSKMRERLQALEQDIVVITGASLEQLRSQLRLFNLKEGQTFFNSLTYSILLNF